MDERREGWKNELGLQLAQLRHKFDLDLIRRARELPMNYRRRILDAVRGSNDPDTMRESVFEAEYAFETN